MNKQEAPNFVSAMQQHSLSESARETTQRAPETPPSTGPTLEDLLLWSIGGGGAAKHQEFQDAYARNVAAGASMAPQQGDPEPKTPSETMMDLWTSPEFFDELKNVAERAGPGV